MKYEQPEWSILLPQIERAPSVEAGAGIYLYGGATHLAGHDSAAEAALLGAGALLVATVRFERNPGDGVRPHGPIRSVDSRTFSLRYDRPSAN